MGGLLVSHNSVPFPWFDRRLVNTPAAQRGVTREREAQITPTSAQVAGLFERLAAVGQVWRRRWAPSLFAGGKCQVNASAPCKNACVQADAGPPRPMSPRPADTVPAQDNGGAAELGEAKAGQDGGWLSYDAADGGTPEAADKKKAEGCGAGPVGGSTGWACLRLVWVVAIRRRWASRTGHA